MNTQKPLSPKAVGRRYLIEMLGAMALYVAIIFLAAHWLRNQPAEPWRVLVALLPLVPVALVFVAVLRFMLHTDEMIRRVHINALAIAAGLTAFLALTWGCLEMVGLPKPSAWWTFVCLDVVWGMAAFVLRKRMTGRWCGSWADP